MVASTNSKLGPNTDPFSIFIRDLLVVGFAIGVEAGVRILLIADIHANWPALAAIQERFDACLFLGDAVDYAADPVPCIEWLRQFATAAVRGNHDHSLANECGSVRLARFVAFQRPCVITIIECFRMST